MSHLEDIRSVADAIREAQRIAICSHINPDGDTTGTGAAMRLALLQMGKEVAWFDQDPLPADLSLLAGWETCRRPEDLSDDEHFDLLLCVDISDDYRMGTAEKLLHRAAHSAQIDHHGTNPRTWTEVSAVDGTASACAVVAFRLMEELGTQITGDIARCLYTGICTDTGNLSYSLQPETFRIISRLLDGPMTSEEMQVLNHHIFCERPLPMVRLLQRALSHLQVSEDGSVTSMYLTRQDFADCGANEQHTTIVVNYGLDILGVKATVLAREILSGEKGEGIKLSFRSVKPYNISEVAALFGGGGHAQAAGATVHGLTLEQARTEAVAALIKTVTK